MLALVTKTCTGCSVHVVQQSNALNAPHIAYLIAPHIAYLIAPLYNMFSK